MIYREGRLRCYYINTSEIRSELSRENFIIFTREDNMLSSHVKRSPSLLLHNKSRLFHRSLSGVYIINRILHPSCGYEFYLLVFNSISHE